MRIAVDGRYINDHYPGIGRYLFNLLQALPAVAPEHEFTVLSNPALRNTRYDLTALKKPNLGLVPCHIAPRTPKEQIDLPLTVRRLEPNLFHAPYYITAYHMPCPLVVTIYDVIPTRYPHYLPSRVARIAYALTTRLALRAAAVVITLSRASRRDLIDLYGVSPERIVVTPLASAPHFRPATSEAIAALRARLGLPERYVLYLGINKPHKNLVRLIEAWAHVTHDARRTTHHASRITLVIAGREDPRYPEARQRATELNLDNVLFLGDVAEADLPALYSGATLFVFPSLYEGFGLPVIEAMACGVPVACSNASSLPEVAGDAALLFDPTDEQAIAEAISQGLHNADLRTRLRQRGFAQAARFSWQQTARLTLEAYRTATTV